MSQQINLYQETFRRGASWLSARRILKMSGAFIGLLLLLYAQALAATWLEARSVKALERRKVEQEQRLIELKAQIVDPAEGEVLASEIDALLEEVRVRQRLYEVLEPGAAGNTEGFSSHLVGLARQRIHGVWLRSIRIGQGGQELALVGSTLNPEGVPQLLEKLSAEPAFMGRQFRRLLLQRESEESTTVNFTISTMDGKGS